MQEKIAPVRRGDLGIGEVVRLGELVDRDGDVHALDAVGGDADRSAEVGRGGAGAGGAAPVCRLWVMCWVPPPVSKVNEDSLGCSCRWRRSGCSGR